MSAGTAGSLAPRPQPPTSDARGRRTTVHRTLWSAKVHLPGCVAIVAIALEVVALGLRGWVGGRGYFYLDDFVFTARAADHAAFDPKYLLEPYNNHLMPGSYLWVWLLTRVFPFGFWPVVATCLAFSALGAWLFYGLLRELFGRRPAILAPFAVLVLSPVSLPGTLWWAAALNQLPQVAAMAATLWCHTLYLRSGRLRYGALGALSLLVGLAFSEKTILVLPVVLALTVLFFSGRGNVGAALRALARHWPAWTLYALVAVPYAAYYGTHVPSPARELGAGNSIAELAIDAIWKALAPGLLGGPWHWRLVGFAGALADPPPFAAAVGGILVASIVVLSIVRRREAWRGWVIVIGYAAVLIALLAVSRATFIGSSLAVEYRYFTDFTLVAGLGAACAFIPLAGHWSRATAVLLEPRGGHAFQADEPSHRPSDDRAGSARSPESRGELSALLPRPREPVVVGIAVCALAASSMVSTISYDQFWRINPARPFFANAIADFNGPARNLTIADAYAPPDVAWGVLGDYATTSHLFSPLHRPPRTLLDGPGDDPIYTLDGSGHVRRAIIQGIPGRPGPVKDCGYELRTRLQRIPLTAMSSSWVLTLRVGYISGAETPATVVVNSNPTQVRLHRGLNALYLRVRGPIDVVTIGGLDDGVRACTDEITVGGPVALPGGL